MGRQTYARFALVGALVLAAMATGLAGASSALALPAQLKPGPNQPAIRPPGNTVPLSPSASETESSLNWSGYVAGTGSEAFKSVSSSYVQPAVTCPVSGAYTVFWVGLDGWFSGSVEQDGTLAYCEGSTPVYYAWWEMYPTNSIQPTIPISPGDVIQASVKYASGHYTLAVKDKTAHAHSTTKQTCASKVFCARNSAEWIIERPGYGGLNFAPLADWHTTSLSSDKASDGGKALPISSFSHFGVDMFNNGSEYELATVGSLSKKGNSFTDTWDAAK